MNNEALILETMMEIKSQLGEMHGTMQALDTKLTAHVVEDKEVEERVTSLEHSRTKHKSQMRVWGLIGTGAATAAGLAMSWFTGK